MIENLRRLHIFLAFLFAHLKGKSPVSFFGGPNCKTSKHLFLLKQLLEREREKRAFPGEYHVSR